MWRLIGANNTSNSTAYCQLEINRLFHRRQASDPVFTEIYNSSYRIREKMDVLLRIYRTEKRCDARHSDSLQADMENLKHRIPEYYGRAYCTRHLNYSGWQTPKAGDSPELALSRLHTNMTLLFSNLKEAVSFGNTIGNYLYTHKTEPRFIPVRESGKLFLYSIYPVPAAEIIHFQALHNASLLGYDPGRGLLKIRKTASRAVLRLSLFDNEHHCHYEMDYLF